jgi:hypothetical protein
MAQCGDPAAGDCCVANGTPACSDAECCNLICGQDPFCCDSSWDSICANAAVAQCGVCGGGGGGGGGGCDSCATATPIFLGDNVFANSATGCTFATTGCGNGNSFNTNFYTFTPAETGFYRISTCNAADFDTVLSVSTNCDPFSVLACNDDGAGCAGFTSTIANVELIGGVAYTVGIGGFGAGTFSGSGTVSITQLGAPGAGCAKATEAVVGFNNFDTSTSTEIVDLAGFCDPGPFGDDSLYNVQYFTFTPTKSGLYSVSTCALAGFDTRLAVMEGCSPVDGVLACNDDGAGCPNFSSLIEAVELEAGVEYIVLVGGYSAIAAGFGQFEIAPFVPCELATPTVTEAELCGEDLNGGCNSPVFATEPIAVGDTVLGTFWADGDFRDTDWYLLDITSGTEVSLSIRSSLGCFAAIVGTDCGGIIGEITSGECPEVTSVCLAPGQYYVVALTDVFTGYPCGGPLGNDYTLEVTGVACDTAPPANDNCADATVAIEGANPFDNTFATTEVADPSCGFSGAPFTKDVWFTFTASQDGDYNFETCTGSAPFDTGIEIWDSCPSSGGFIVACNDDGTGCPVFASSLNFGMVTGQTVFIRVGGWQGATGATELIITFVGDAPGCGDPGTGDCCLANGTPFCEDAECCNLICGQDPFCCDVEWDIVCANAAVAQCAGCSGGGGGGCDSCSTPTVVTVGANAFSNVPTGCQVDLTGICDPGPAGTDIIYNTNFYSFTPATTGTYSFSTCGTANFDTKIAVMNGCDPTAGVLACNDDGTGCAGFTSFIGSVNLTAGTTYTIALGGYAAATTVGSGTLTIAVSSGPPQPPANDECANAIAVNQGPTNFSNQLATGLTQACIGIDNDVWFKYTATGDQPITISMCAEEGGSATFDTGLAVREGSCDGTIIACNDDTCGLQSRVTFNATCGTTYYIAVGAFSPTQFGSGTFVLSQAGSCAPPCPGDLNGDGQVGAADLAALLNAWGTPGADLNGDGTTDSQDLAALLNGFGPCQ